jgi:hypothetical protein
MTTDPPHEVTQLLIAWSNGNQAALDRLMPLVDRELHRLAHHYMRRENAGHTLQTTALVNEAYLKLVNATLIVYWKNRAHFFALSRTADATHPRGPRAQRAIRKTWWWRPADLV